MICRPWQRKVSRRYDAPPEPFALTHFLHAERGPLRLKMLWTRYGQKGAAKRRPRGIPLPRPTCYRGTMQTTHRPPRTAPWSRPLADLVGAAIDPVLARQGFSQSDIILYWEDIVGARLAAMSEPIKLRWPPRHTNKAGAATEPATLVIRVEGSFALEM